MQKITTIELAKEDMKFSAGHFTVFTSKDRENLHGHNYRLYASFTLETNEDGIAIDYRFYKEIVRSICKKLDEIVIIPALCKYLSISETDTHIQVIFNSEVMLFLKRDIIILPITNATVEELSSWFIDQIRRGTARMNDNKIIAIKVKIFSSPGQSASATWKRK